MGEYGSGKSSIAYHVAFRYFKRKTNGLNPLVYVFKGRKENISSSYVDKLKLGFERNRIPTLFVFDDFHTYGNEELYSILKEKSSEINRILVVKSHTFFCEEHPYELLNRVDIDVAKSREALGHFFKSRIHDIASHLKEPEKVIMRRIDRAVYNRANAYGFVVSMCDGFVRIKNQLRQLSKKKERYDLILFIVSLFCACMDESGIELELIKKLLNGYVNEDQIRDGLNLLAQFDEYSRRFVVEGEHEKFRIPHIYLAGLILKAFYEEIKIEDRTEFVNIIKEIFNITFDSADRIEILVQETAGKLYLHKNLWIAKYLTEVLKGRQELGGEFFKQLSFAFHIYGLWDPAESSLEQAIDLYLRENNQIEKTRCEYWLSFIRFHRGHCVESVKKYREILQRARKEKKLNDLIPKIYRDLAQILAWKRKLDRALNNAEKALKADEQYGFHQGWSYCWLGQVFLMKEEYDKALKSLSKAKKEFEKIPIELEAKKIISISWKGEPDENNPRQKLDGLFWATYETATVYQNQQEYEKAIKEFEKSIEYANLLLNNRGLALCYAQIAGCYYKWNKPKDAYCYFQMAHYLLKECGSLTDVESPMEEVPEFRGIEEWIRRLEKEHPHLIRQHLHTSGYRKCKYQSYCIAP